LHYSTQFNWHLLLSAQFTPQNVDKILDEVRPYLLADGGNVAVSSVDAETKSVDLVLQGACGSCPSSTVTMKMGIERVLKESWPDLGEVRQVAASVEDGLKKEVLRESVEGGLKQLEGAIGAMGGRVELLDDNEKGEVEMKFTGSDKIRYGLELAILDITYVSKVTFVE